MADAARQVRSVFGVALSMLALSPIERGTDSNTKRDPDGLSGQHKSASPQCRTDPDPVTGNARILSFFTHSAYHSTSFGPYSVFWESIVFLLSLFENSFLFQGLWKPCCSDKCNQPKNKAQNCESLHRCLQHNHYSKLFNRHRLCRTCAVFYRFKSK